MSTTREQLRQAARGYQRVRYPGDLAADVFARLDAGERHAADTRLDDVDAGALRKFHPGPMRIGFAAAGSPWRPVLAIAAAVAVLASAAAILVHTGTTKDDQLVAVKPPTPPTVNVAPPARVGEVAKAEEAVPFTIVPSYQSFAFSVPTSLTPASVEEYDRQARETAAAAGATDATTDDGSTSVQ